MSTSSSQMPEAPESQEQELCLQCLEPNLPGTHFCRKCGGQLTAYAATGPFEALFAEELAGHRLLTNKSEWIQFRTVTNERWWTGNVVLDVAAYLMSQNITGDATAVTLVFDNTLQTAADQFSNAFIKKKGIDITVNGDPTIPEPTTAALLALGALACGVRRR